MSSYVVHGLKAFITIQIENPELYFIYQGGLPGEWYFVSLDCGNTFEITTTRHLKETPVKGLTEEENKVIFNTNTKTNENPSDKNQNSSRFSLFFEAYLNLYTENITFVVNTKLSSVLYHIEFVFL